MKHLFFTVPLLVGSLAPPMFAQDLPEGKGKAVVEEVCGACHGVDLISGRRATKEGWGYIVDDMVSRGASATTEQIQSINEYLSKNLGQVNPNKAAAADIVSILEVTPAQADAIVKYRMEHGDFKTLDDFKKVPGLPVAEIDKKKDRLVF
jgi:competence ComEA-like helix-hairpin-helix protein